MENQHTQQTEASVINAKKINGVKGFRRTFIILGIIATAVVIIWFRQFAAGSSSRLSTLSEIAAQKEFQEKWNTTQEQFQQKVDTATKEAEQISYFY